MSTITNQLVNSQKILSIACVFVIFPLMLFSQTFSVSGSINNENGDAISYANIIAIKANDSTIVSGTSTDDSGRFLIEQLEADNYIIKATFLGLEDYTKAINLNTNVELGTITLVEKRAELLEVEIVAPKPTLKREADRLIFNVENTSLTEGNVWDILQNTPGILMINDEISVKNASNIIYLINDRRVYLSGGELQQLLSGTTANAVQAVEVITNPPAKYDAEGGAVINIKMSKNLIAGYNGSLYSNGTQGIYPRIAAGTNHFFKGKKTSFYIGYNFNAQKLNRINDEAINYIENGQTVGRWETDIDRNTAIKSHAANLNFDYAINNKNTFSISANALLTPFWKRNTDSFTEAADSTFASNNNTEDDILNIGANADYVYQSTNGTKLSFNVHHTDYRYDRFQDVNTVYRDASNQFLRSNSFNTTSAQDVTINSAQIDLSLPFKKGGSFEMGVKGSKIDSESDISQIITNGTPTQDLNNSGIFDYKESNYALYVSFNKDWEHWSMSAGVRTEKTDAEGRLSSETEANKFDYFKTFPNANITHRFNENHSLGLSYSKRIERPTYSNLNPFKFFLNDNAFVVGNPNLQPAIAQLATLSYSIKGAYTFEVYYRHEDNTFSELSFQDNTLNQIRYQASNLKEEIDYGFDFILYKPFTKHWTAYIITSAFNDKAQFFAEENNNSIETNERWSFYGNAINYFTFLKDNSLTANISLLYISPIVDGSAEVSSRTQVDIGLKKTFNKGRWVLSLAANDIFVGSDFTTRNSYLDQDNQYYARFDNRWVRLGLRLNFGNTRLSTNESIKELEERNRLNKSN